MPRRAFFTPELFTFLRELRRNNRRDWLATHKERYERVARAPMLDFIEAVGPKLSSISRHLVADPRPTGGSFFRIYRDTRFSADKSPYKTHVAAQFRHDAGRDVHAPGFYLHLEPGEVFGGGGIWRPDPAALKRVRGLIAARPDAWKRAVGGKAFRTLCQLGGESLARAPKGFDPDHPLIDVLKRKDFIVTTAFDEELVCSPELLERFVAACRAAAPLLALLTEALELPW